MERLNKRLLNLKKGVESMTEPEIKVSKLFLESVCEYMQKLKEYKDLEEQGLLLKLPCKVGDTVYIAEKALRKRKEHGPFSEKKIIFESENRTKYVRCKVVSISYKKKGNYMKVRYTGEFEEKYFDYETGYDYRIITDYIDMNFVFSSIGKTVFLTKEEAEQALQTMKEKTEQPITCKDCRQYPCRNTKESLEPCDEFIWW